MSGVDGDRDGSDGSDGLLQGVLVFTLDVGVAGQGSAAAAGLVGALFVLDSENEANIYRCLFVF